jgi:hypothetical protein
MSRSRHLPSRPTLTGTPLRALALFALILLNGVTPAEPATAPPDIQLVTAATSHVTALSAEEATQLFLGQRTTLQDGTPVTLIDLPAGPERTYAYQALTGKNPVQIRANWSRLVFSGRTRPPLEAHNQREALELLAQTPNAIGYLPASIHDKRLKVLLRLP